LKVVIELELCITGDRAPGSWCRDAECFGMEIDPCRRLIEQQLTGGSWQGTKFY